MANHPLIKDVEKWIVDSFSFMDAIGYDVVFDDEEIKNTNIIVADIDGLTDSDFEKGKKNLLKLIPNKIKAEFPYLRIRSSKDGDYFIMYIVLADNDDYFKTKNIPYVNLNESKESARKSIKESKTSNLQTAWDNDDENLFASISYWLYINNKISRKEYNDLKEIVDNWNEYRKENPNAKIIWGDIEVPIKESARKSIKESDDNWYKLKVLNEMLDAMGEDEYNIPKLGIYGVTKNINLDEGAIRALIKYYK